MLAFLVSSVIAQSPITITVADIADKDEIYTVSNANPFEALELGVTGEDMVWNFESLAPIMQDSIVWIDAVETNPAYFFFWFGSDVAEETGQTFDSEFFSLEDIFNFYKRSTSEFSLTGQAGTITGIPLPILYDDPEPVYQFPMEFENSFTSSTGFEFDIPGIGVWLETRDKSCTVDGWGTITTPYGTFEVLRQKCVNEIYDLFTVDLLEIPIEYTATEYRWVAQDEGIPILQVNTQTLLGIETATAVIYKDVITEPVNIVSESSSPEIKLINDGSEVSLSVNFNQPIDMEISVLNLNGQKVIATEHYTHGSGLNNYRIETGSMLPGYYFVQVLLSNGKSAGFPFVIL